MKFLLFVFCLLQSNNIKPQAEAILSIEIISSIAYDYRYDSLFGYRLNQDSTLLLLDDKTGDFISDTFTNHDLIVFMNENFEYETYSDNYHTYQSNSGIKLDIVDELIDEINIENYELWSSSDTMETIDSSIFLLPMTILIPSDFDFEYLRIDTLFFIELMELNSKYNELNPAKCSSGKLIDEFIYDWISFNALFHHVSYQSKIEVRIKYKSGKIISLIQSHPGSYSCRWDLIFEEGSYTFFNPYINELIFDAMDSRFVRLRNKLIDYRSIDNLVRYRP